jgi:hypothetical protein
MNIARACTIWQPLPRSLVGSFSAQADSPSFLKPASLPSFRMLTFLIAVNIATLWLAQPPTQRSTAFNPTLSESG